MTIQPINIGAAPNDDTGDDPRTVGQKLNSNFTTSTHAASRDVGTASGNVMEVGAGGLLATAPSFFNGDLNSMLVGGVYYIQSSATNIPPQEAGKIGTLTVEAINSNTIIQTFRAINSIGEYRRAKDGAWSDWKEVYHTGIFNYLQNTSGGSIASNATTAGSNLTPAQSGTWINASSATIANNGYGLWIKQ